MKTKARTGSKRPKKRTRTPRAARSTGPDAEDRVSQDRLQSVIELSSEYYWETDTQHRLTQLFGRELDGAAIGRLIGRKRWELGGRPLADDGSWNGHRRVLEAREKFRDFVYEFDDPEAGTVYLSISGMPVFDRKRGFLGYRGITRDVTRERRVEMLQLLENSITRMLSSVEDIGVALTSAMQAICRSEKWEAGSFWRLDEKEGVMRYAGGWCTDEKPVLAQISGRARNFTFGPGEGLPGCVLQTGEVLWVPEITRDPRITDTSVTELTGWHSAFLFPIHNEQKVAGVLDFYAPRIREPDEGLLRVIGVLGKEIGNFYRRAVANAQLRASEARFRSLTELTSDWYWEQDAEFRFTRFEGRDAEFIKMLSEQYIGRRGWETGIEVSGDKDKNPMQSLQEARQTFRDIVMESRSADETRRFVSVSGEPTFNAEGLFTGYRGLSRDISQSKEAEEQIQYLATHDSLTGLPNRAMFQELLSLSIESARRYERSFAVLFIDLDRFKIINDTLGHGAGDVLLKEMSARLKGCLRSSDVLARLGGDEFVVLIQEIGNPAHAATVARNVLSVAYKPVDISGQECRVTASVGISVFPDDAQDGETLMKNADLAMYQAKSDGKNMYKFYSREIKAQSIERLAMETNLRRALERHEFRLQYQPKLDLATGAVAGTEALLRWQSPELGLVMPSQFIGIAEEIGLIVPIGKWVLREACRQNMAWQKSGLPAMCIAVNLSPRQFNEEELLEDIAAVLQETRMPAALLELEVTESMVMQDVDRAARILKAIKRLGVRLAIDDFGTGYSSLAQLKRFPIDTLKVDRSFIRDIPENSEDRALTEAIIAMGKSLSLTVVAEGVETGEQQAFLSSRECDQLQGYYFARPVDAADVEIFLRAKAQPS